MRSSRIRHLIEAMFAALLFTLQNIVYGGPFISIMFIPLFAYLILLGVSFPYLERDIYLLLFSKEYVFGRLIAIIGLVVFLWAAVQLLKGRTGLVLNGLYSVVRHPQYTGIVVMTLGLTVMCLTLGNNPQPVLMWLMEVFGYVALARYEEWQLEKKHRESYRRYRQNVPFMFPLKTPSRIPEPLFTILISIIIASILLLISPNFPRF